MSYVLVDEESDNIAYGPYETAEAAYLAAYTGKLFEGFEGEPWGEQHSYRGYSHGDYVSWRVQLLEEFNARPDRADYSYEDFTNKIAKTLHCNVCRAAVSLAVHQQNHRIFNLLVHEDVPGCDDLFVHCQGSKDEFDEDGRVVVCPLHFVEELGANLDFGGSEED